MRRRLEYERAFVEELTQLGVRLGLAPADVAAEVFFESGIDFCLRRPAILPRIIEGYIPDHLNYQRLIKRSKESTIDGRRVRSERWGYLADGYLTSKNVRRHETKRAFEAVGSALTTFFPTREPAYIRRIIVAIGAASRWTDPDEPEVITPVGKMLSDTRQAMDGAAFPGHRQVA